MEDENGLELSLGLSCGGSSSKSKTSDLPQDHPLQEGNNRILIGGNMNFSDVSCQNFFEMAKNQNHEGKQNTDQFSCQHDTFLATLAKCSAPTTDGSNDVNYNFSPFTRYQELWVSNNNTTDPEEEKSTLNKRKLPFEDIDLQRKCDKTSDYVDKHGKTPTGFTSVRNSRVSATTEDGSFGEGEDVAESEAEGSNSLLVSQCEDSSRCSGTPKYMDKHILTDLNGIDSQGQKLPVSGNESNSELEMVAYGIPPALQPLTVMTVPYPVPVKVPTSVSAPSTTGFPSPCVMQVTPLTEGQPPVTQAMNTSNLQLALGCSMVQLPVLETNSPWANCSQPTHATSFGSKDYVNGQQKSEQLERNAKIPHVSVQVPHSSLAVLTYEKNTTNLVKGSCKQVGEVGTSTQIRDECNGNIFITTPKEVTNQLVAEGFPHEGNIIKPGIMSNVKFGGSGSYPDLPWVSTTGPGPNGKTISGVTYKYNKNQIKIVCACHGSHMSPEEFIQHASADAPNTENNIILA